MRDNYDPDGWKRCTLRHLLDLEQRLWLVCGTCQKSRYFDTAEWAGKYAVNLDTPLKTLGKALRCQRCGTRGGTHGVSAYAQPYDNLPQQSRTRKENGPICPACGSDDVESRRMLTTEFPNVAFPYFVLPRFVGDRAMRICGCASCDNWWTQREK